MPDFSVKEASKDQSAQVETDVAQTSDEYQIADAPLNIREHENYDNERSHEVQTTHELHKLLETPNTPEQQRTHCLKVMTAALYFTTSCIVTFIEKSVLTAYRFPSFTVVGLAQWFATIVVMYPLKKLNLLKFPGLGAGTFREIFPLPLLLPGSMLGALGGTQELSIPIFTTVRRFTVLMIMAAEYHVLNIRPNPKVRVSIFLLILGAVVAIDKPNFNLIGYVYVLISDVFRAYVGVYTKKILIKDTPMNKYGLHFHSALFIFPVIFVVALCTGDLELAYNYPEWRDHFFVFQFLLCAVMDSVLTFSAIFSTLHNSALTTIIIASLKHAVTTLVSMSIGFDYLFSWQTCIGIGLSFIGSLHYTYVVLRPTQDSS